MARRGRTGIGPVQQDYLALLRSALWGTEPGPLPNDILGVMNIADIQKTRPLIISALQKAGYKSDDPAISGLILNTAATHLKLNHKIAQLVPLLRSNGIEPVLLKGQGVAHNYPEPMLRECGDIDLYVGSEHYQKACEVILNQASGVVVEEEYKHTSFLLKDIVVEIHRASDNVKIKRQDAYYQSISYIGLNKDLVPISFEGEIVNTPADSFNAFYIFYHFWRHFFNGGVGLRQICDWMLFLHSRAGNLDTSVIADAIENLNLRSAWQIFGSIAVNYLGLPADEMPFYKAGMEKKAATALSLILEEGNFGRGGVYHTGRPAGYLAGKLFAFKVSLNRYATFFRLFPEFQSSIIVGAIKYFFGGIGRLVKKQ